MIDKLNRLFKLLRDSQTYEQFEQVAVKRAHWMLSPHAQVGHKITRAWLQHFYKTNGGK